VILSAFVPTLIAQLAFKPRVVDLEEEEALGAEDVSVIHRRAQAVSAGQSVWEEPS
jgi:hypothetical protein